MERIQASEYRAGNLPKAARGLQCGGRRQQPEANLQKAVMRFLALALPEDAVAVCYPLGGGGYRHGQRVKALGAMRGFPDIFIVYEGAISGIELKSARGRVGGEQAAAQMRLAQCGMITYVCRSLDDVQAALENARIPNRAPVLGWTAREVAA